MSLDPGTIVAKRYRIVGEIGRGGMGEVFSAENTRTGRMVAIKLLRAEAKTKQSAIERFRREARAAGAINSDFVTEVIDVEDDTELGIVLVFELLEGESLVERLKRTGPIHMDELWGIVEAVWMGLADAHAAGIIHRDMKPSNVFLETRRGGSTWVKLLDFGISKLPKEVSIETLTQVGQSLGTFSFMPPEQIGKAKSVDHRADIYSVATLAYQALSGKLPYKARNVVHMMDLKRKTEPRTLADVMRTPVDPKLEAFIARGLARDPDQRFQNAADALDAWRQLRPANARSIYQGSAHGYESLPPASENQATVELGEGALSAAVLEQARQGMARARMTSDSSSVAPPVAAQAASQLSSGAAALSAQRAALPTGAPRPVSQLPQPQAATPARSLAGQAATQLVVPAQQLAAAPPVDAAAGQAEVGTYVMPHSPLQGMPPVDGRTALIPAGSFPATPYSHPTPGPHSADPASLQPISAAPVSPQRPQQPSGPALDPPRPQLLSQSTPQPWDTPEEPEGMSTWALILGGLALVGLGFGIVAVALRYFG